jgi:hypothetical protein
VLIIIAVADKCLTSVASLLGVRGADVYKFADKLAPLIELMETSPAELRESNSKHKLVQNSQVGFRLLARNIIDKKGARSVADRLYGVAEKLLAVPQFSSLGHSIVMFDAINELLLDVKGGELSSGYRPTVRSLYEKLSGLMHSSADYWLQRAKSINSIENDPDVLLEGIEFAKKAAAEARRERTADNAEFTIALLYGKLCHVTKYKNTAYVAEAIRRFNAAIQNYDRNANYVRGLIMGGTHRKNSFELLCDYLSGPITDITLLKLRSEVGYLLGVRSNYERKTPLRK